MIVTANHGRMDCTAKLLVLNLKKKSYWSKNTATGSSITAEKTQKSEIDSTQNSDSENYHSLLLSRLNFTYLFSKHLVLFSYINLPSVS